MKKFEYLRVPAKKSMVGREISVGLLNKYGDDGWELLYITNWNGEPAWFYFKRELPQ